TEGVAAAGLDAELTARAPFRDVEINFQDAPLGQNKVDPQSERKLDHLAQIAASLPEEQVLRHLLGDGRAPADVVQIVRFADGVADFHQIDAVMATETSVLGNDYRQCHIG